MPVTSIKTAPEAWKLLNGIFCAYKPASRGTVYLNGVIKRKLCDELNAMKIREPQSVVEIRKLLPGEESTTNEPGTTVVATLTDRRDRIEIIKSINYADHPAVIGPRYDTSDFKCYLPNRLDFRMSGVQIIGLNEGCKTAKKIELSQWIRTFIVSGRFGLGTANYFDDGKILEKSTYHNIRRTMVDRLLASLQASQQRHMFTHAGVPIYSQQAYDLASSGMLRPVDPKSPVLYSLKCTEFKPPHFDIEMKVINADQDYLAGFIHDLGLKLHSLACCTKIRCIEHGPFNLEHALLMKHWGLENVIQGIVESSKILKDFNLRRRDPLIRGTADDNSTTDFYDNHEDSDLVDESIENENEAADEFVDEDADYEDDTNEKERSSSNSRSSHNT